MVENFTLPVGSRCIKYLMFTFNLLFVITGIILISVGVTIRATYADYKHLLDDQFFSVPTFLIVVGSIIFFIAFFGCCGAVRENYCMILTFTGLLIVVCIFELSGGIAGYVLRNDAYNVIESKMKQTMNLYNETTPITYTWDKIQSELECCGIHEVNDWMNSSIHGVPFSCYKKYSNVVCNETSCPATFKDVYQRGCLDTFSTFIKSHAVQLGGVGIGLAFIQATGIGFAIYLARALKRSYETV